MVRPEDATPSSLSRRSSAQELLPDPVIEGTMKSSWYVRFVPRMFELIGFLDLSHVRTNGDAQFVKRWTLRGPPAATGDVLRNSTAEASRIVHVLEHGETLVRGNTTTYCEPRTLALRDGELYRSRRHGILEDPAEDRGLDVFRKLSFIAGRRRGM